IFPESAEVILMAQANDPFAPQVLARVADIERTIAAVPRIEVFSALTLYERSRPGARAAPAWTDDFRRFAPGTGLLRREGLVGADFLGIAVDLKARGGPARDEALRSIDRALAPFESAPAPLSRIGRVGGPYVDAYLEAATARASLRYFP